MTGGGTANPGAALYRVTYFEVAPDAAAATAARLRDFAAAGRRASGNALFDGLAEIDRAGRFAMVEAWRDQPALDGYATAAEEFCNALRALLIAPFDARPSLGLSLATPAADDERRGAVHVLTHVDVVPPTKDEAVALLEQLARDSRKEPGVLGFDVLQQASRPNHLTLREAWAGDAAFSAHVTAAHVREFRRRLGPLQGALYDERRYRLLR